MTEREASDKVLRCAMCGEGFVFSAGEQELFRLRGIRSEPVHCPNCARGRSVHPLTPCDGRGEHGAQLYPAAR
ncbi:MAG: hypothetical protein E6I75_27815 [Chloroflexi bacterium]|nr:MAG: hypothetical protein E6I75_27815 [Chloroflexota bacterium]